MQLHKVKNAYPTIVLFAVLLSVSLGITYMLSTTGEIVAPVVISIVVGVFLIGNIIADFRVGFYFLFLFSVFMFYVNRIVLLPFPIGTLYDALAALVFLAVLINARKENDWRLFKNAITITFFIVTLYQVMQVVNPAAKSTVAWLVAMRNNTSILIYIACFQLFSSLKEVKRFTIIWLSVALLVGLYGIWQEYVGFFSFEERWLNASPDRIKLYFIWGKMRKFSFLSDPSSYGLFTAYGALAALALSLGPFKTWLRVFLGFSGLLMLMAMSYSGTRTAIAMVAVGIVFYITLTIRNRRTIVATAIAVFCGVAIVFGPFYSGTANRIRSTFKPGEDASMEVRDIKRVRLQKYVQAHPIGGGLYTTGQNGLRYSAGHQLAQGWDPDSGYLLIALEMGWIGLILFMTFFMIVMINGINQYFSINDPMIRSLLLAHLVPFFALSVAHYTQDAIFTKPMNIIGIATYALIFRLPSFERKLESVELV